MALEIRHRDGRLLVTAILDGARLDDANLSGLRGPPATRGPGSGLYR